MSCSSSFNFNCIRKWARISSRLPRNGGMFLSLFPFFHTTITCVNSMKKKETKEKTINVFQFRIRKRGLSFQSFPAYGLAKHWASPQVRLIEWPKSLHHVDWMLHWWGNSGDWTSTNFRIKYNRLFSFECNLIRRKELLTIYSGEGHLQCFLYEMKPW